MFWNVRPTPASTMSLGRALRKIPNRSSCFWYQTGRMIASRSDATSSISATKPASAEQAAVEMTPSAPQDRREAADDERRQRPTRATRTRSARAGRSSAGPGTSTSPAVGSMMPSRMLKNVVLPAPFGPIRLTIEPSGMAKSTLLTATRPPNRRVTCARDEDAAGSACWRRRSFRQVLLGRARRRSRSSSCSASVTSRCAARACAWLLGNRPSGRNSIIATSARPYSRNWNWMKSMSLRIGIPAVSKNLLSGLSSTLLIV